MMTVAEAQEEVRTVFRNGSAGQLVSGGIWLMSAAFASWGTPRQAILILVLGGVFIFPLTQLLLRLSGRPFRLQPDNPLGYLAMQVAFIVPLLLPVAGGAALHNINWFYPACAMIVGAHYLPFVFLYGMGEYAVLSGVLLGGGLACGMLLPRDFATGGWFAGAVLLLFAGWAAARPKSGAAT
jgi:uncharacterized protein DUF7010